MTDNYEKYRNEVLTMLTENGLEQEAIKRIVMDLDALSSSYCVSFTGKDLIQVSNKWIKVAKEYCACKTLEGLSKGTICNYAYEIKNFFNFVKKDYDQVTVADCRNWIAYRQQYETLSMETLDGYRRYVSGFFLWLVDSGYVDKNPFQHVKPIKFEKKIRHFLTREQVEIVRNYWKTPRQKAVFELLLSTGCRVSEILNVKFEDVNFETNEIHVFGKGRKHRMTRMNAKAKITLQEYLSTRKDDCPYLIVSLRGSHQINKHSIENEYREMSKAVGFKVVPHEIRHTFATNFYDLSNDIITLQTLLGHSKIETTTRYAEVAQTIVMQKHEKYAV